MPASVRVLFKFVVGFFAALQGPAVSAGAQETGAAIAPRSQTLTMAAFIARLRESPALRASFSQNPASVLREHGIDPTPFALADRLDQAQLEGLLADWAVGGALRFKVAQRGPQPPEAAPPSAPSVVYGPPPGLAPRQSTPPAPVYEPPPGPPPKESPPADAPQPPPDSADPVQRH